MYFMDYPALDSISARTYSKFGANDELRQLYTFEGAKADFSIKYTVEDFTTGFVNMKNGACLSYEISWASNIEQEKQFYELLGDKGGVRFDSADPSALKIFTREDGQFIDIMPRIKSDGYGVTEFGHFLDGIISGLPIEISPPEQAVQIMKLIDAAYESSESGGRQVVFP